MLKAGFHMIADDRRSQIANNRRRSQKRLFPYNRNDRRADRSHTFRSAEKVKYTRACRLKNKQHGGRRRGNFAASELISSVCHEAQ